jgi:hypothetical protein
MNRRQRRGEERQGAAETSARPLHHSPWFWIGVAMFMAAILTYVFSEDLSLRPRLPSASGAAVTTP